MPTISLAGTLKRTPPGGGSTLSLAVPLGSSSGVTRDVGRGLHISQLCYIAGAPLKIGDLDAPSIGIFDNQHPTAIFYLRDGNTGSYFGEFLPGDILSFRLHPDITAPWIYATEDGAEANLDLWNKS